MLSKYVALRFNPSVCFATSYMSSDRGIRTRVSAGGHWLASVLRKHGLPFIFLNAAFHRGDFKDIRMELERLRNRNIRIMAVSLFDDSFQEAMENIRLMRKMMPNVWIVAGGPVVNNGDFGKLAKLLPEVDCFIKGDAEYAFLRTAKVLLKAKRQDVLLRRQQRAISRIEGIYFRHFDFIHRHDEVNTVSQRSLNGFEIFWQIQELRKDIEEAGYLSLNTRRGCRYRCIFCALKYRRKAVAWSGPRIIRELRRIKELIEAGILPKEARSICFTDDDFFQNPVRVKSFLKMLTEDKELNGYFEFNFEASLPSFLKRDGNVDLRLMELLSRVRKKRVLVGTDAFCDSELEFLRKNHYRYEEIMKVVEAFERYEIPNVHFVILTTNQTTCDTLIYNIAGMLNLLGKYPGYFRIKISNYGLIVHPGSTLGRLVERREAPGDVVYFYAYDGQYHGVILTKDEVVRSFLANLAGKRLKLDDDTRNLISKRNGMDEGSPEYVLTDNIIRALWDFIERSGRNKCYFMDLSTQTDYYLNMFVIQKMLDILHEVM